MDSTLTLTQELYLGEGNSRVVYQHPLLQNQIIKIEKTNVSNYKPNNKIDFLYFNYLKKKKKDLSAIATCHGWVTTNLGEGLAFEKITNFDNSSIYTFEAAIKENTIMPQTANHLFQEFVSYLKKNTILFADIALDNLVCKKIDDDKYKLIIIDGLGSRKFKINFFLYLLFPSYAKKKVQKQIRLLEKKYQEIISL